MSGRPCHLAWRHVGASTVVGGWCGLVAGAGAGAVAVVLDPAAWSVARTWSLPAVCGVVGAVLGLVVGLLVGLATVRSVGLRSAPPPGGVATVVGIGVGLTGGLLTGGLWANAAGDTVGVVVVAGAVGVGALARRMTSWALGRLQARAGRSLGGDQRGEAGGVAVDEA